MNVITSASIVEGETDRATVVAHGLVVDVIANENGTVYVEFYAYASGEQAVVENAQIDRYTHIHPNLRLRSALVPMPQRRSSFTPCARPSCQGSPAVHNANSPDYVGHDYR